MAFLKTLTRNVDMMKALPMNIGFVVIPSEGTHLMGIAIRHGSIGLLDFMIDNLVPNDFTKEMLNISNDGKSHDQSGAQSGDRSGDRSGAQSGAQRSESESESESLSPRRKMGVVEEEVHHQSDDVMNEIYGTIDQGDGVLMMIIKSRLIPSDAKIRYIQKLSRLGLNIDLNFNLPEIRSLDATMKNDLVRLFLESSNQLISSGDFKVYQDLMSYDALSVVDFFFEKMTSQILSDSGYAGFIKSGRNLWMNLLTMLINVSNNLNIMSAVSKWFEIKNFIGAKEWKSDWQDFVSAELIKINFRSFGVSEVSGFLNKYQFNHPISDQFRDELIGLWQSHRKELCEKTIDVDICVQFYWKYGDQTLIDELYASRLGVYLYANVVLYNWELICNRQPITDLRPIPPYPANSSELLDSNSLTNLGLALRLHVIELEMNIPNSMTNEEVANHAKDLLVLIKEFPDNFPLIDELLRNLAQVGFKDVEFVHQKMLDIINSGFKPKNQLRNGWIEELMSSFLKYFHTGILQGDVVNDIEKRSHILDDQILSNLDHRLWKTYWLHPSNLGRLKNTEDLITYDDLHDIPDDAFIVLSGVAWSVDNLSTYVLMQTNGKNKYDSSFKLVGSTELSLAGQPIWTDLEFSLLKKHPKSSRVVEIYLKQKLIGRISDQTANELKNCLDSFDPSSPYFGELFAIRFPEISLTTNDQIHLQVIKSDGLLRFDKYIRELDSDQVDLLRILDKNLTLDLITDVMHGKECFQVFYRVLSSAIKNLNEFVTESQR